MWPSCFSGVGFVADVVEDEEARAFGVLGVVLLLPLPLCAAVDDDAEGVVVPAVKAPRRDECCELERLDDDDDNDDDDEGGRGAPDEDKDEAPCDPLEDLDFVIEAADKPLVCPILWLLLFVMGKDPPSPPGGGEEEGDASPYS